MRAQAVDAPGRVRRLRPDAGARVQPDVRDDGRAGQGDGSAIYLRPETAQGIFVNFKNVLQFARKKPPFGIAQVGKSFRNEITPGNFIFRTREFEQMEMEFFVPPADAERVVRVLARGAARAGTWTSASAPSHLRLRAHDADELSHYSSQTSDIEYLFPIGWSELEGIANRGDFDLRRHAEYSGETLEYFDQQTGERYVPYVIEPAAGADRATLAFLVDAYDEEEVDGETRTRAAAAPAPGAGEGRGAAAAAQGRAARAGARDPPRAARRAAVASTTRAARSGAATAARTRSARRGASRSTTRRSRTARSPCATATRSRRSACRSPSWPASSSGVSPSRGARRRATRRQPRRRAGRPRGQSHFGGSGAAWRCRRRTHQPVFFGGGSSAAGSGSGSGRLLHVRGIGLGHLLRADG